MKLIRPILDKPSYHKHLEKEIYSFLYENIFKELFAILDIKPTIKKANNSKNTDLITSLIEGKLTYEENKFFKGKINASISRQLRKLGARFNKTAKAYQLEPSKLPTDIQHAIAQGKLKASEKVDKINNYLDSIEGRELPEMKIELSFGRTLSDLDKQFDQTTRKIIPDNLEVGMNQQDKDRLKDLYASNLEKYVKDWHDEAILRLRSKVMDNTLAGYRAENLIRDIKEENGISWRKSKFLARQEASLITAKYREVRYTDNGINYYVWSTSGDEKVRKRHRELDRKIFRFDNPPIVDIHAMRRANPSEDFNCRCVAIPVLSDRMEIESKLSGGK